MRDEISKPQPFRAILATRTRSDHEALHCHPVLERLLAKDLCAAEYGRILTRYLGFFKGLEQARARLGVYEGFALLRDIENLQSDLGHPARVAQPDISPASKADCLGMLYVLHGSRFGAGQIYGTLSKVLPDQSHQFMRAGMDRELWRSLLAELESGAADPAGQVAMIRGATRCFRAFGAWMMQAQLSQEGSVVARVA